MDGILWPVIRNFLLTGLAFVIAVIATLQTRNGNVFFLVFIALSAIHILVWQICWKKRDALNRRRFLGLDGQDS